MVEPLNDRWLSVEEVAAYLGINKGTLYKWITRKNIPAQKIGSLWKFKKDEIDEWVKTGGASKPDKITPDGSSSTDKKE